MQPESFPTDDSLGRSVQPASAPLSAKEGAFGEENAPYEAVFGDVSKIRRGGSWRRYPGGAE